MTMSQPNSGFGATQAGRTGAAAPAAPPNPKIQAVDFAIQLAKINSTTTPQRTTTADQIVADATTIADFMGGAR